MLELPGVKEDEVAMEVQNGRLVISGEQALAKDLDENAFFLRERPAGRFSRILPLPAGIQASEVETSMETASSLLRSPEQTPQSSLFPLLNGESHEQRFSPNAPLFCIVLLCM
ncbi:hypothetical protein DFH11DRAFT_1653994 [Phellopilus nigrolimitatus]|nr:hypothetical protein DFH11DRAFT_1653994 [Phellopilus nigrolimitatus]